MRLELVVLVALVGVALVRADDPLNQEADIEIVGYGDNCDEQGSLCDQKSGLSCSPQGQCQCDPIQSLTFDQITSTCVVNYVSDEDLEDPFKEESPEVLVVPDDKPSQNKDDKPSELTQEDKSLSLQNETKVYELDPPAEEENDIQPEPDNGGEEQDPEVQPQPQPSDEDKQEYAERYSSEEDIDLDHPHHNSPGHSQETEYESCKNDAECQLEFGSYSRCIMDTGECECFDSEGRETHLVNQTTCYLSRQIGDECSSDIECDAVINGNAWCHVDLDTDTTSCQCQPFHIWDSDWKECLPLGTQGLDSPCKSDAQCSSVEALGRHAMCSEVTGRCECSNPLPSENKPLAFFGFKCVAETELNGSCATDQECEASLGPFALCSPETLTCACMEGHSCDEIIFPRYSYEPPQMSGFTIVLIGFLGAATLIAAFLCVALRRPNAYSFVTLENEV